MESDERVRSPQISAFHKALTGDPESTGRATDFFADFMRVNNPNGKIVRTRQGRRGADCRRSSGSFDYELTLMPKALPDATQGPAKPAKPPANKPN